MFCKIRFCSDEVAYFIMSYRFLMCLYFALSNAVFGKVPRILGGVPTSILDFPFIASVRRISNGQHICGGAIISDRHILTAAHCVSEHFLPNSDILFFIGGDTLSNPGNMLHVQKVFVHDKFTGASDPETKRMNDIALVKVVETIEFNEFQKKIDLPTSDIINTEVGKFAGWGVTSYPSDVTSDQLQQLFIRILDANTCMPYFPFSVNSDQFCGFNRKGIGICIGDSGGPLVYNEKIVGVASISIPCGTGIPDIYSNVYSHLDFIVEHLDKD